MPTSLIPQGVEVLLFCIIIMGAFVLMFVLLVYLQKQFFAWLNNRESDTNDSLASKEDEHKILETELSEQRREVQLSAEKTAAIKAALLKRQYESDTDA